MDRKSIAVALVLNVFIFYTLIVIANVDGAVASGMDILNNTLANDLLSNMSTDFTLHTNNNELYINGTTSGQRDETDIIPWDKIIDYTGPFGQLGVLVGKAQLPASSLVPYFVTPMPTGILKTLGYVFIWTWQAAIAILWFRLFKQEA